MDRGINPPCSAQQLPSVVTLCTETNGVIEHLTAVTTLHTRLLFFLTVTFSLPFLFLNFVSSTFHSLLLLSLCNLVDFIMAAKPHSIHRNDNVYIISLILMYQYSSFTSTKYTKIVVLGLLTHCFRLLIYLKCNRLNIIYLLYMEGYLFFECLGLGGHVNIIRYWI